MNYELERLIQRCVVRYLNGDIKEFNRLKNKAVSIYEHHRHLYVPIEEIIKSKTA